MMAENCVCEEVLTCNQSNLHSGATETDLIISFALIQIELCKFFNCLEENCVCLQLKINTRRTPWAAIWSKYVLFSLANGWCNWHGHQRVSVRGPERRATDSDKFFCTRISPTLMKLDLFHSNRKTHSLPLSVLVDRLVLSRRMLCALRIHIFLYVRFTANVLYLRYSFVFSLK